MSKRQTINVTDKELEHEAEEAFSELLKRSPEDVAKKCSVVYIPSREHAGKGKFIVNMLNKTYSIDLLNVRVTDLISEKDATPRVKYVILKYLVTGDGTSLGNDWVNYRDMLASPYLVKEFENLVLRRLSMSFGNASELYERACKALGGKKEKLGGISYSFFMLPKVKILCQLWQANEKEYIPAASNISFISRSERYLQPRDLGIASVLFAEFLEKAVKKML